jgi:cathepsin B
MFTKLFFVALILLVAGSQAQQPLDAESLARVSELLQSIREGNLFTAPQDGRTDLVNFAQGFLQGVEHAHAFDSLKECIVDDEAIMDDLERAVTDIKTKNPEKVKEGVHLIGEAAQLIPAAAAMCRVADAEIQKLVRLIESFTNPKAFFYYVGKSLLINHVEVLHEIQMSVSSYEDKNMTGFGFWVGSAMATIFLGDKRTLRDSFAEHLNEVSGWEATNYPQFEGMTVEEFKGRFLGANSVDISKYDDVTVMNYEGMENDIPESFNSDEQWPGCVHPIRDQQHCGSCWAFAASEVLSDRFCIASDKQIDIVLSPQYLVSCNNVLNHGCNGGVPLFSWWFMSKTGLVSDDCLPYQSGSGTNPVACNTFKQCADGKTLKYYKSKKGTTTILQNPTSIQTNILAYGPVEAAFSVYEDFTHYKGGIYKHTSGSLLGGHAVKIVGWGKENGENYWIVANSWNTTWGEKGFFRIAFGEAGIDSQCVAGQADVSSARQSDLLRWF